jgi:endonuclease IV
MEIGIKIYPEDLSYAKRISRYCNFFEVMAVPESNFRSLKSIKKPFTIHTIHSHWGFNPANPEKHELNSLAVDTAKKAADILDADTIVVHPGYLESDRCSLKSAIRFIKAIDSRFIVENMPAQNGFGIPNIGGKLKEMKNILKKTKKSMCLDFPHAAEYAHKNHIYYLDFIRKMMNLKPRYFHISDTRIQNKRDLHLHMKEGNLKLKYFEKIVPKDSRLLIETAHEFRKQHNDILFLKQHAE